MEYKNYKIVNDGVYGYKHIKPIGKGSVPVLLRGTYTTVKEAIKAIDAHEGIKGGKGDKTGSNSRD